MQNLNNPLDRIEHTRRGLETAARAIGAWISADGRVDEKTAAVLLSISPGTLRNQRSAGTAPPFYQIGGGGARVTFSLFDLAVFIESRRRE